MYKPGPEMLDHLKVCEYMCVTCRSCEAEVANRDRDSHNCIKTLKATVARQQETIVRQNTTIQRLERELKASKIDVTSNPYRIDEVRLEHRSDMLDLDQIESGYDRLLDEINERERQHQSSYLELDPVAEFEELKQRIVDSY